MRTKCKKDARVKYKKRGFHMNETLGIPAGVYPCEGRDLHSGTTVVDYKEYFTTCSNFNYYRLKRPKII